MSELDELKAFLEEYETLCQKYRFSIEGCGCCGSPYVFREDDGHFNYLIDEINFDYIENRVKIGNLTIEEFYNINK